jgi:hypothetical protein
MGEEETYQEKFQKIVDSVRKQHRSALDALAAYDADDADDDYDDDPPHPDDRWDTLEEKRGLK